jgi:cytidylate kinase
MTVVAIDGPAGAGKSTVARALARRLGFTYMDSGAMYRAVALAALRRAGSAGGAGGGVSSGVSGGVSGAGSVAREARIELGERVLLDGEDVTAAIRDPAVSEAASRVAADPEVREAVVAEQQRLLAGGDWVAEGRDIGTVVAPHAEVKVFLTADPEERARRRARELGVDEQTVLAEQAIRDERDRTRAHSPLEPAPGATIVDTTGLSLEEVVERVAGLVA